MMVRAATHGCVGVLVLAAGLAGCTRAKDTPEVPESRRAVAAPSHAPPNIVLITVCTLRYDRLGAAGYPRGLTPFLDQLAARGVFFEDAISASSWTKPSVASILTGLTPNVHGMTDYYEDEEIRGADFRPKRVLADEVETLAECLHAAGYATACQINNIHAGTFFNLAQGFDDVGAYDWNVETAAMLKRFEQWLTGVDPQRPVFFFMLTRDPHITYNPGYRYYTEFNRSPAPVPAEQYAAYPYRLRRDISRALEEKQPVDAETRQRWIDLYDAEIAQLDAALSRIPEILQRAGRGSNTLIVVTADHGERLFENEQIGHSGPLDEAVVHIPFILCGPNVPSGVRVGKTVRSIDLYPTLVDAAGARPPTVLQGVDLFPFFRRAAAEFPDLTAFSSIAWGDSLRYSVRQANFKLRAWSDGTRALFDTGHDPEQKHDLLNSRPEVADRLSSALDRWLLEEEVLRQVVAQGGVRTPTEDVLNELRSLGYIK